MNSMKLASVWIEFPNMRIDRPFDYQAGDFAVERGMRVRVAFGHRYAVGMVESIWESVQPLKELEEACGYQIKNILEVIDETPLLNQELFDLAKELAHDTISSHISVFAAMLPGKMKPRSGAKKLKKEIWVKALPLRVTLKNRQLEAWMEIEKQGKILRTEVNQRWPGVLAALKKKNAAEVVELEREVVSNAQITASPLTLTEHQQRAMQEIKESEHQVLLLHGATGSGKTELYLQLANQVLAEGKQVLILVPEIALTPQMVLRVTSRFGSQVAIYHSNLSDQDKVDQYQMVARRQANIVVGTRSAIFLPFEKLGLIVVDEEHDLSYKQESMPRYHARDVAILRAKYHGCKVLLGSATPALDSYARALKNVYQLVELPQRIGRFSLPEVKVVDMRKKKEAEDYGILSKELQDAIAKRLLDGQKIILLLNRRGYHTTISCRYCHQVILCRNCDLAMHYHKDTNRLVCHCCGETRSMPKVCPHCGQSAFVAWGVGTQRVQDALIRLFPNARVVRMDADTVGRIGSHEAVLKQFEEHGDILLGTQMIAKGLDYPKVTLVGILEADSALIRSDYRTTENTFDLIVQACGRSGRADWKGEVVLQCFDTTHYTIDCASKQEYKTFFYKEMQFRHMAMYPPYTYLAALTFSHKSQETVIEEIDDFAVLLRETCLRVLGPSELIKRKMLYRYRLIVSCTNLKEMIDILDQLARDFWNSKAKSALSVDVNPLVLEE
jgi:primosomal protein N' (replication factor Y)